MSAGSLSITVTMYRNPSGDRTSFTCKRMETLLSHTRTLSIEPPMPVVNIRR